MRKNAPHVSVQADPSWRIAIVHSQFYKEEMDALIQSAQEVLLQAGIPEESISTHGSPGSFEIPLIGSALLEAKKADAIIGLGIIVEGETHHAELLAKATTQGIMETQLKYQAPFAFEVLYVDDIAQVRERLDKGAEAANAVLEALAVLKGI